MPRHAIGPPRQLRDAVERRLGGRVVAAVSQPGGFSPGVAARLRLDSGARAFVKAVRAEPNPDSPGITCRGADRRGAAAPHRGAQAARVLTDIRADNILLTQDRVVFVDWPWACIAAPWFDLLTC